jgi:hypothetical protein
VTDHKARNVFNTNENGNRDWGFLKESWCRCAPTPVRKRHLKPAIGKRGGKVEGRSHLAASTGDSQEACQRLIDVDDKRSVG